MQSCPMGKMVNATVPIADGSSTALHGAALGGHADVVALLAVRAIEVRRRRGGVVMAIAEAVIDGGGS